MTLLFINNKSCPLKYFNTTPDNSRQAKEENVYVVMS